MTTTPESPLDLPLLNDSQIPDTLTLVSLIREDLSQSIAQHLTRADEKAYVLMTTISNGAGFYVLALSKNGEYRELEIELHTLLALIHLKQQQYLDQKNYKGENQKAQDDKGAWFSALFTVENDGFISKTEYNYDKPIFTGKTPEEWFTAPETPSEGRAPIWSVEQYLEDLEKFPRDSGIPEWLN